MAAVQPFLYMAADALIAALGARAVDAGFSAGRREDDPAKVALRLALGRAVQQYSRHSSVLAGPLVGRKTLVGRKSILTRPEVAREFAKALVGDEEPDTSVVGAVWRDALPDAPQNVDFTAQAQELIGYFRSERRWIPDVVQQLQLDATNRVTEELTSLEETFAHLIDLLDEKFGILPDGRLQHLHCEQTGLILEHLRGFVGRAFVFNQIGQFIADTGRREGGVVYVMAPPGVGKTALMAKLVYTHNCVYHFNRRQGGGPTSRKRLLGNICAQLVAKYDLNFAGAPDDAAEDSVWLAQLLTQLRGKNLDDPVIIAIDALDEMDDPNAASFIHLPESPVYFVVSTRPGHHGRLSPGAQGTAAHQHVVDIQPRSDANQADIRTYIRRHLPTPGIQAYLQRNRLPGDGFVDDLAARSEGNFMYLRHVLPAVAEGTLTDRDLTGLPVGLRGYYEDHFSLMRAQDPTIWTKFQLPVIAELSALEQPLTINQLARQTGLLAEHVLQAIQGWAPFLRTETVTLANGLSRPAFSIYHSSFQDYLAQHPFVQDWYETQLDKADEGYGR